MSLPEREYILYPMQLSEQLKLIENETFFYFFHLIFV